MTSVSIRGVRFAPILVAVVLTVLMLRLFQTTATVFLLLFIGVLLSLYLRSVADEIEHRLHAPPRLAFAIAIFASLGALALLFWILIPPVVSQTQELVKALPEFITRWEGWLDRLALRSPAFGAVWHPGQHQAIHAFYDQLSSMAGGIATRAGAVFFSVISVFAVGVMAIYLALHPALYREWLIALFPPLHRDLVRDLLTELGDTLRSWMIGQMLAMAFLAAITAAGLWILNVPFWLPFGIFTGLVAIVPFFGTLLSTTLPALFVVNGPGYYAFGSVTHALLVVGLGVIVHLAEGNVVSPLVMSRRLDLPPVLTIVAVLIMGRLLGPLGLIVALPALATLMVVVRRILITRIYEGQGFRKTSRERPMVLRVPAPGGGVAIPTAPPIDMISLLEHDGKGNGS